MELGTFASLYAHHLSICIRHSLRRSLQSSFIIRSCATHYLSVFPQLFHWNPISPDQCASPQREASDTDDDALCLHLTMQCCVGIGGASLSSTCVSISPCHASQNAATMLLHFILFPQFPMLSILCISFRQVSSPFRLSRIVALCGRAVAQHCALAYCGSACSSTLAPQPPPTTPHRSMRPRKPLDMFSARAAIILSHPQRFVLHPHSARACPSAIFNLVALVRFPLRITPPPDGNCHPSYFPPSP